VFDDDAASNQAEVTLKPDFAASHRTPDRSQDPQDHADKHQNAADCFQNRNAGDVTDYSENDTEDNHAVPLSIGRQSNWTITGLPQREGP
jgi:5-methylcytosine-specific restriction endonuclease McrA